MARHAVGIKIYLVLHILHSHAQLGARPGYRQPALGTETAYFAEVIVPYEMVADVMVEHVVRLDVAEETVGVDAHRVFAESEFSLHLPSDVDVAYGVAKQSESGVGGISDGGATGFLNAASDPEPVACAA